MKIRTRIIIIFFLLIGGGFYLLIDWVVDDLRVRYLESIEEVMVDSAYVLSSMISSQIKDDKIDTSLMQATFLDVKNQTFKAQIYDITKTQVDLRVYITDSKGIVLFDSFDEDNIGKDFTKWRDVSRTLIGKYGARSTRYIADDPTSRILYIAAPIWHNGKIIGVVTLGKPSAIINQYVAIAKPKIWIAGLLVAILLITLVILFSAWITRPIKKLINYTRQVRDGKKPKLPNLNSPEMKEMGHALDEMREALEGKKYVENYVQTLTHEIKSPVAAIKGAAELLEEGVDENQSKIFLDNIKTENERIKLLVDKLLELSAIENRKSLDLAKNNDLRLIVQDAVKRFEPVLKQKDIHIVTKVDSIQFEAELFLIEQIIANLIQNAVYFSPDSSKIFITGLTENKKFKLLIEDEGPGIPEYALERVFERFFSLKRPDTGKKSTGLGLSFVKEVVLLHQGQIKIGNRSKTGVCVELILPLSLNG